MKNRAVSLERCPEGIRRGCFLQKQAPDSHPAEIPTVRVAAPTAGRDIDYIVGGTRRTLLTVVNLGCIAMHVTNGRIDEFDKPDWLAFDLDPADAFASAARAATLLKRKLEDHGLQPYVKTSGGRGLHVCVPLRRGAGQDRVRAYAVAIAREMALEHPKLVTVEARKARRRAPVYLDVMLNASAQTIVPPFSVRWQRGRRCRCRSSGTRSAPARSGGLQPQDRRAAAWRQERHGRLLRTSTDAAA